MPCDSAAAGLIALGLLRNQLGRDGSDDLSEHYKSLLDEAGKKNGRNVQHVAGTFKGSFKLHLNEDGNLEATKPSEKSNRRIGISRTSCRNWKLTGSPALEVFKEGQQLDSTIYSKLISKCLPCEIMKENLQRSHSSICLSGHSSGENPTKQKLNSIKFKSADLEISLKQLLTVHCWDRAAVSRMTYYNPRSKSRDRNTAECRVVCADGCSSFLDVLENRMFDESDVIGVIDRSSDREALERVQDKMSSMRQWYDIHKSSSGPAGSPPHTDICELIQADI